MIQEQLRGCLLFMFKEVNYQNIFLIAMVMFSGITEKYIITTENFIHKILNEYKFYK